MSIDEARTLIAPLPLGLGPERWLDLGCGGGTFTLALAELLPDGSTIEAWDVNAFALKHIPDRHHGVSITTRQVDFLRTRLPLSLNGIMMANTLHFIKDQEAFLRTVNAALHPSGSLLLAEYDTDVAAPSWVPFPFGFQRAVAMLAKSGFAVPQRLGSRASAYARGDLYTAFASRAAD